MWWRRSVRSAPGSPVAWASCWGWRRSAHGLRGDLPERDGTEVGEQVATKEALVSAVRGGRERPTSEQAGVEPASGEVLESVPPLRRSSRYRPFASRAFFSRGRAAPAESPPLWRPLRSFRRARCP